MSQITISNHGQLITATNYWTLAVEEAGKLFVSCNAGAVRILIPRVHRRIIEDMRAAEHVILSRGPWPDMNATEAVEFLFEDHSESPFALQFTPESFDLLPAEPAPGKEWVVSVWDIKKGKPHKAVERRCHWRRVQTLPWLKPWDEKA